MSLVWEHTICLKSVITVLALSLTKCDFKLCSCGQPSKRAITERWNNFVSHCLRVATVFKVHCLIHCSTCSQGNRVDLCEEENLQHIPELLELERGCVPDDVGCSLEALPTKLCPRRSNQQAITFSQMEMCPTIHWFSDCYTAVFEVGPTSDCPVRKSKWIVSETLNQYSAAGGVYERNGVMLADSVRRHS